MTVAALASLSKAGAGDRATALAALEAFARTHATSQRSATSPAFAARFGHLAAAVRRVTGAANLAALALVKA